MSGYGGSYGGLEDHRPPTPVHRRNRPKDPNVIILRHCFGFGKLQQKDKDRISVYILLPGPQKYVKL